MPPCLVLSEDIAPNALAQLLAHFRGAEWQIDRDLSGDAVTPPIGFGLAVSPNFLSFGYTIGVPDGAYTTRPAGTFCEGLWEEHVLELFIAADEGSGYQEFNLSPSGAWWTQTFSGHRLRSAPPIAPRPEVEIINFRDNVGCYSFLRVARSTLPIACDFSERSRANVTSVVCDPHSKHGALKRYCAYHSTGPGPADFHSAIGFQPLKHIRAGAN